jgi:hypothetical protein
MLPASLFLSPDANAAILTRTSGGSCLNNLGAAPAFALFASLAGSLGDDKKAGLTSLGPG